MRLQFHCAPPYSCSMRTERLHGVTKRINPLHVQGMILALYRKITKKQKKTVRELIMVVRVESAKQK